MLQKLSISDKCCSSELSIHQIILKKMYTTVFNIDNNNKCFLDHQILTLLISGGSCDTEDWSNDAEHSDLSLQNK